MLLLLGHSLEDILQKSPFNDSTPEYKNLKISILLTSVYILKNKKKLNVAGVQSVILWHLPKSMSNYTKILLKEFFTAIKQDVFSTRVNIRDITIIDAYIGLELVKATHSVLANVKIENCMVFAEKFHRQK